MELSWLSRDLKDLLQPSYWRSQLIGVIFSFALSTTSLLKEIQTVHHRDQLSKNVSIARMVQANIDRRLQEAILFMGH